MIIKRILGLIILLTALALIALSLAGAYYAGDALAALSNNITTGLDVAGETLEAARGTLALTRDSVGDVTGGLTTAIDATAAASQTLEESRPLVDNISAVATQEVPEAVEGMQAALPNMIEVASIIDRTLVTLSSVGIDREIPLPFGGSIPLRFDLGIDYEPETSFDASLRVFEHSLVGLPESLRGLEDELAATNANLASLSADLQATSDNLTTINTRIGELEPLIDRYSMLIDDLNVTLARVERELDGRLELIRYGIIGLFVAVALSQLAPLYLGWELLSGRRDQRVVVEKETHPVYVEPPVAVARPSVEAESPARDVPAN